MSMDRHRTLIQIHVADMVFAEVCAILTEGVVDMAVRQVRFLGILGILHNSQIVLDVVVGKK